MRVKDIYWLAGLLEGDGTFYYYSSNGHTTPVIALSMTDKDICDRVAKLFKTKVCGPYDYGKYKNRLSKKCVYQTSTYGARAIGWMMTLFTLMGQRRRDKIKSIIARWKENPHAGGYSNFS